MQPQRRRIRLRGLNYAQPGLYFITICCHGREPRFGYVQNSQMQCNEFGVRAAELWLACLERFQLPIHHPMQMMPDHLHAIIELPDNFAKRAVAIDGGLFVEQAGASPAPTNDGLFVGATLAVARDVPAFANNDTQRPILGDVVGAYKSMVMQSCLKLCRQQQQVLGRFWQRNYYEHIIRDGDSYQQICHYIKTNPQRW